MARCRCTGAVCTCVVLAGANVTVTGNGSPDDPYVINSAPTASGSVEATVGLAGDGTLATPLRVLIRTYDDQRAAATP